MVQWLGLGAFTAVALGSIPGQGTKIPPAHKLSGTGKKKGKLQDLFDHCTLYCIFTRIDVTFGQQIF